MEKAIIVDRLIKNFQISQKESGFVGFISSIANPTKKTIHALKGVSFTVQSGELVGFIGPNGAGKTTTMKILSGLIHPTSGFVSVLGFDPWEKSYDYLKKISLVMGQKNQLWWDLPVIDSFEFNKEIYEIPDKEYQKNLSDLVEILNVEDLLKTQVRKLSLGQRMKMELIASLIHKPEVMFLDEPTIGLDLVAQQALRDFIYEYNRKNGATIILTSHNMNDLIDLTRRVIVIDEGIIIYDGPLEDLSKKFAKEKIIKLTLEDEAKKEIFEGFGEIKKYSPREVSISVPRETTAFVAAEILQSIKLSDLSIEEPPIEDVIRRVFKGELAKEG